MSIRIGRVCGQSPETAREIYSDNDNVRECLVCKVTNSDTHRLGSEPTFPPAPPGGWPNPVESTTRGRGQWAVRRHIGERLYARVIPATTERLPGLGVCWEWQGSITGSRSVKHGQIMWRERYGASPQKTHRVAWELWHGSIPADKQINHHCDNPRCVRLDHLYLGTQRSNMGDAAARGRFHVARTTDSLTPADRLHIYSAPAYRGVGRDLALRFGVSEACISKIRRGRFIRPRDGGEHVGQHRTVVSQRQPRLSDVGRSGSESVSE